MDSSWVEVLPLPKSRPGWIAAILLFTLGALFFLSIQPKLAATVIKDIDSRDLFTYKSNSVISHVVYPRALNPESTIPIKFKIQNDQNPPLQIQSISVVWHCYWYSGNDVFIDNYGSTDYEILPIVSSQASINFQMPNCVTPQTSYIRGSFSIILNNSDEMINLANDVSIELNHWQALRNSILNALASMQYGLGSIAILALISVWIVEYKHHQNVWLSSREGWDVARQTFYRALIRFLIILAALTALLVANNHIGEAIIGILLVILLIWLFQPNLLALWISLRNRRRPNLRHNETSEEGVENETGTSSHATRMKTKPAENGNKSKPPRTPLKAKSPRKKPQKKTPKPSSRSKKQA